jgi:DNA-binding CsgD family transcriptional regulator
MVFPLVGRDRELGELLRIARRPPAVVLVEGEAGVGKTRLVHELSARLCPGVRRLVGRCHPLREPFPLGPVVEALAPAGQMLPAGLPEITGVLRGLLPELAGRLPPAPLDAGDPRVQRHRVFRAVRELLAALGPALLTVEDLHWADTATLELVRYLGHRPPDGLFLVLTARPEDAPVPLGDIRHVGLRLDRLSAADVRRMVTGELSAAVADRLHERTGGLPLAVAELVRLLPGEPTPADVDGLAVPATMRSLLAQRLSRLPAAARRVVDAAAVLGVPHPERTLTAVAGLRPGVGARGLVDALRSGLLCTVAPGRYGLRDTLALDAAYGAIPEPDRHRLHARAERVLRAARPQPLTELARHARLAGRAEAARRHAERAADEAARRGDNAAATTLLRSALDDTALDTTDLPRATRLRLTVKLARAATLGLAHTEVVPLLRHVLATEDLPAGSRGEIRLSLGLMLCNQEVDTNRGIEQIRLAAAELRARPDLAVRALSALAMPDHTPGPVSENLEALHAAMRLLPRVSEPAARAALLVNRASTLLCLGDPTAWAAVEELPEPGRSPTEDQQLHRGLCNVVNNCLTLGHYGPAARFLARARADGPPDYPGSLLTQLGIHLDLATGRWAQARRHTLTQARSDLGAIRTDASMLLGVFALLDGDPTEAHRRILAACPEDGRWRPRTDAMTVAWLVRALLELGRPAEALAEARPLLATIRLKGAWVWAAELVPAAVDALLATGLPTEAAALVTEFAAGVDDRDAPLSAAAVARCRATLATGAEAVEGFLLAAERYAALPRPYDAALATAAAGHHLAADGAALLVQALAAFERLGARADAAACRARLRMIGVAAPNGRGRPAYGRDLSPRERQVLGLVTRGRTNREIAAELYLSERTVEGHVARLLRKLGLRNRRDLWTSGS